MRWILVPLFALVGIAAIVFAPPGERFGWYAFAALCAVFVALPFVGERVRSLLVTALLFVWIAGGAGVFAWRWYAGNFVPRDAIVLVVFVAIFVGMPLSERVYRRYRQRRAAQ